MEKEEFEWLESNRQVKRGVQRFQKLDDSQKRSVLLASTFTPSQADAIKSYAHSQEITHSELIRLAVYTYLKNQDALNTTTQENPNQTSIWDSI